MTFYRLATGDYDSALDALRVAADRKPAALLNPIGILHISGNVWNDPVLEENRFREARRELRFIDQCAYEQFVVLDSIGIFCGSDYALTDPPPS